MCGIIGYVSQREWNFDKALHSLNHRGPDYQAHEVFEKNNLKIGLGHARLSIIDLTPQSNQPFCIDDGNFKIIFNGEIYNYKKLRTKLIKKYKIDFKTNSDTEVLLQYYKIYGTEGFVDLEGMFAFAIFDKLNEELILARDQLGIKPVYYWKNVDGFFWSSELKALWNLTERKPNISKNVFTEFLSAGFIYEPNTGYENVFKIPPGHFIKISVKKYPKKIKCNSYWSVTKKKISKKETIREISRSIKSHLVSDVPLGLFFSGGVDSTLLLSQINQNIKSFIVKSEEEEYKQAGFTSDYKYGKKIAELLKVDLEVISLSDKHNNTDSLLDNISTLSKLSEEPISDYTFISSMQLSKVANEKGYKVMLSGLGADEIFAGYPRYQLIKYGDKFKYIFPFIKPFFKYSKYLEKKAGRFESFYDSKGFCQKYNSLLTPFSRKEINLLLLEKTDFSDFDKKLSAILKKCPFKSPLKKAMFLDLYGFLSHNFLVADKSSMQASIELRVPLATPILFEMCMNLPDENLMSIQKTKLLLKNILYKILPKNLIDRKKAGFNPPLDQKINDLGKDKILSFVKNNGLYGVIEESAFEYIVSRHFDKVENNTFKIYQILYLSAWYFENKR